MKPNPRMLFGNIFDDRNMTPNYIERFALDVQAKLTDNNGSNEYDDVLNTLTTALVPFQQELSEVDTTLNTQVGKTLTVDNFIKEFKAYMQSKYINIAAALGGEKTPELLEFYPRGKSEYTKVTKTQMPTIVERLKVAAVKHQVAIGATISGELQGLETKWKTLRENQLQEKAAVKTNRTDRSVARRDVEIALLETIHFIGKKFPGDVKRCLNFFNFNLLFAARHKSLEDPKDE
ncbi:hypothetical protein WFZ85_12435 [Flavobacterium sp. j3]|uniref:Uncharacterized protein n=1 Tax=Flavobacterium aureirubrum TaxID=3133147 RepID=A0ABU9N9J5_9FLAO